MQFYAAFSVDYGMFRIEVNLEKQVLSTFSLYK
jgi:hypothetical protein